MRSFIAQPIGKSSINQANSHSLAIHGFVKDPSHAASGGVNHQATTRVPMPGTFSNSTTRVVPDRPQLLF
jgi:hypothetical protein